MIKKNHFAGHHVSSKICIHYTAARNFVNFRYMFRGFSVYFVTHDIPSKCCEENMIVGQISTVHLPTISVNSAKIAIKMVKLSNYMAKKTIYPGTRGRNNKVLKRPIDLTGINKVPIVG